MNLAEWLLLVVAVSNVGRFIMDLLRFRAGQHKDK